MPSTPDWQFKYDLATEQLNALHGKLKAFTDSKPYRLTYPKSNRRCRGGAVAGPVEVPVRARWVGHYARLLAGARGANTSSGGVRASHVRCSPPRKTKCRSSRMRGPTAQRGLRVQQEPCLSPSNWRATVLATEFAGIQMLTGMVGYQAAYSFRNRACLSPTRPLLQDSCLRA